MTGFPMDERHDIYQAPPPPPPSAPKPSYDLPLDHVRQRARRQTTMLVTVVTVLVVLAAVNYLISESHWARTAQLREALRQPLQTRVARTNVLTGTLAPEVAVPEESFDTATEAPPPGVSSARLAEAMGHLRIANEYLRARDMARAEEEVRAALAIWPTMNAGLRMLGLIHIQRGQFDQAIAVLERAQRGDPFNPEAYNNMATAFMQKRMHDRAEELLQTALQVRPEFVAAHFNLGLLYILLGRYDEAIGHLEEALARLPNHPGALNNIAVCHIALGRYAEARGYLLRLIEQPSPSAAPFFNLAITHVLQGESAEAMSWIRKGAEHCSPSDTQTYLRDSDFDRLRGFPEYQLFERGLYPELPSLPPAPET